MDGLDCGLDLERGYDYGEEEEPAWVLLATTQKERRRGEPRSDVERVAEHYGVTIEEACDMLEQYTVEELLPERGAGIERGTAALSPVPPVFERAVAMPALLNPRATIDKVEPLSFRPGDRIDLAVYYTPANDEESAWQTVVNVIQAGSKLVQERQHHTSMRPGQIRADCDTGMTMPDTAVNLTIEVWGHPDYATTTWPDP